MTNAEKKPRGRPRKEKSQFDIIDAEVFKLQTKVDAIHRLIPMREADLKLNLDVQFKAREKDLYNYISKEFNRFLKSEALSEAIKMRLNEYAPRIAEAEFNRMINIIESQPKLTLGQRISAAIDVLRTGR